MSSKKIIATDQAPAAVGPYSQACKSADLSYLRQLPLDPASGKIVAGGIKEQTERTLANLQAVLAAAADLEDVVKTTLYIKNMDDFSTINEIYGKYFRQAAGLLLRRSSPIAQRCFNRSGGHSGCGEIMR